MDLGETAAPRIGGGIDRQRLIGLGLAAAAALVYLVALWGRPQNHDVAWYLIATRRWLEGARLYVDIVEVNPPLNFYLTVPSIWLADLTGISDSNSTYLVLCALIFTSIAWSWLLLSRQAALPLQRQILFLLILSAALTLPDLQDVAQRDQLYVIFVLPWLLGQVAGDGRELHEGRIARGVFAAVGICLKPYFLLLPLLVTLWQIGRNRSLWPVVSASNLAIAAVGALYVLLVWLVHPAYLKDVVPMAVLVYRDNNFGIMQILLGFSPQLLAAILLPLALALMVRGTSPALGLFIVATLSGIGTYLLQWTGFTYHLIPFLAFSMLGLGWILVEARKPLVIVLLAVLSLAFVLSAELARGFKRNEKVDALAAILGGRSSVTTLSTDLASGPPLAIALGAEWASRYPVQWLVPGVVNGLARTDCKTAPETCKALETIGNRVRTDTNADLDTFRPEAVVIDRRPPFIRVKSFTWEGFMGGTPFFATLRRDYRLKVSTGRYDVWVKR